MIKSTTILLLSSSLFSLAAIAAIEAVNINCDPALYQDYTPSDFIDNKDGSVTDLRTSLTWAKCSIGQTYTLSSNSCSGSGAISYATWSDALAAAESYSINGITGWRLPNIKELGSLVDRSCAEPAINLTLFPNTISSVYYSSTPFNAGATGAEYSHLISRVIDFAKGTEMPLGQHDSSLTTYAVRAVKGGYR
ncbi:DUF1566 domain-containing protein [Moritella marina ATCC 15381]|uniref:DUF1566 domain-containing protein n=1 Tax=Moritella marina ATCC 15381 TaxID=1202962 RepID=A0A5J6WNT7_MORMI|nr:DUF1566 domain-containing protein [Moritella marina]QFI39833.1 DUF1566 domain-containing protein [Moritella marina ATCC 15381]